MFPKAEDRDKSALEFIADMAEAYEASVISAEHSVLVVVVRLRRADDAVVPYTLSISAKGNSVKARELSPDRLPSSCPDRHINGDGTFCTHWDQGEPLRVIDSKSAARWWDQLLGFLKLQERARNLRRWPSNNTWAHGDAAIYQWHAERCAEALGLLIANSLRDRTLIVKKHRGNGGRFRSLHAGPKRIYSVWWAERRVATLRQLCFCGSGFTLISCGDHAQRAYELVAALQLWEQEERRFWQELKGAPCCGTLEDCPLAERQQPIAA